MFLKIVWFWSRWSLIVIEMITNQILREVDGVFNFFYTVKFFFYIQKIFFLTRFSDHTKILISHFILQSVDKFSKKSSLCCMPLGGFFLILFFIHSTRTFCLSKKYSQLRFMFAWYNRKKKLVEIEPIFFSDFSRLKWRSCFIFVLINLCLPQEKFCEALNRFFDLLKTRKKKLFVLVVPSVSVWKAIKY